MLFIILILSLSLGIQPECSVVDDSPDIDYFLSFFDVPLMELIRDETNRYHTQKVRDVHMGRTSVRRLVPLYAFF